MRLTVHLRPYVTPQYSTEDQGSRHRGADSGKAPEPIHGRGYLPRENESEADVGSRPQRESRGAGQTRLFLLNVGAGRMVPHQETAAPEPSGSRRMKLGRPNQFWWQVCQVRSGSASAHEREARSHVSQSRPSS
jgi:hypothetical protein